ncbi:2'-5' RNA ligase family protein [Clostridium sp. OS1-26]|uniref:2'-5' RNA ligase family protein n=1 Tax=Clostridium sp. OS1-26 TaxID=3070681 RepID=UPI0027E063B4|nr:2'-5' RNA ligase family protein [Clostridium sp. OS1-26]WML35062.1 2'-5' RNA ligase family protein [Clostridium sp. OS1-26]
MKRYVLVCNIEGDALKFHEKIASEVCHKFNKKRQKLPAHFTIKAPFETDKIDDMVNVLEKFSHSKVKTPIRIQGFGKFRQDVVYMDVEVSNEAKQVHDELIDEIAQIPWVEFKKNEGKDRVFHCTILSRRIQDKFNEIWEYVNQYECEFDLYFDNLSLYIWRNNTWEIYKKFKFNEP